MYKFLKENYGNSTMWAILGCGISVLIGLLLMITNTIFSYDKFLLKAVYIISFIFYINGLLVYLYLRKKEQKRKQRKIYFIIVIFILGFVIIIFSPGLLFFNLFLSIILGIEGILKKISKNKSYCCIFLVSLLRVIISFLADYPNGKSNYSIYAIEFICFYIGIGLVYSTVIYFFFNDKETLSKYDNNIAYPYILFLNKSLYLIFCITLILNLIKYTIGFGNDQFSEVATVLLNISSIIIAWKRVNDMNKKSPIIREEPKNESELENDTSINEHWREDVSNHLVKTKESKKSRKEKIIDNLYEKGVPIEILLGWLGAIGIFVAVTILLSFALWVFGISDIKIHFNSLFKCLVFIIYTLYFSKSFSIARIEGNRKRKNIHLAFLFFYCCMIILSFAKESIIVLFGECLNNVNIYNACRLLFYGLESMKEAMLASIIFDTYKNIVVPKSEKEKQKTKNKAVK